MRLYFIVTIILAGTVISCDSTDTILETTAQDGVLLAPRNPETYMVYIQPDDTDYHLMNPRCLKEGRSVVSEAEALELDYAPCEICFPSASEPTEAKVYVLDSSADFHRAGCRYLDETQTVVSMTTAVDKSYLPCPDCYSELVASRPLNTWVTPETGLYHRAYCPNLTDDKLLMPLAEAKEAGYTPDPTCYWQKGRIIRRGVAIADVLYNPEGAEPYNETITLENRDGSTVHIGGWILTDEEPRGVYEIPMGTTIPGFGTWSVSGSVYNPTRDTQALFLSNRHDTLILYDDKGRLVDAVSW